MASEVWFKDTLIITYEDGEEGNYSIPPSFDSI